MEGTSQSRATTDYYGPLGLLGLLGPLGLLRLRRRLGLGRLGLLGLLGDDDGRLAAVMLAVAFVVRSHLIIETMDANHVLSPKQTSGTSGNNPA